MIGAGLNRTFRDGPKQSGGLSILACGRRSGRQRWRRNDGDVTHDDSGCQMLAAGWTMSPAGFLCRTIGSEIVGFLPLCLALARLGQCTALLGGCDAAFPMPFPSLGRRHE